MHFTLLGIKKKQNNNTKIHTTMVKHIVCFKLKEEHLSLINQTRDILLSMRQKCDLAKTVDVHIDELHSERSFDIMLEVSVDSFEALEAYQKDPYHCNIVKKHMASVTEKSITMDYAY